MYPDNGFENVSFGAPTGGPLPTLPSHQMPIPAASPLPGAAPAQSVGNSVIEQLLARLKQGENTTTTGMADVGQLAGNVANDERMNRLTKGGFSQQYDQNMLAAQTGRNQNEDDALKKLYITSYLKSGGFKGGPKSIQMDGQMRTLPSYGGGPTAASPEQQQSAGTLENMLQQRLKSGGSYLPQDLGGYATPGKVEQGSRWGGVAASGLGLINDMMNRQAGNPGVAGGNASILNSIKSGAGNVIAGMRK